MFKNYLKTAFRSFAKHKTYTLINIVGLGLGIAAFILISAYVFFEKSFDLTHSDGDKIYRVESRFYKGEELTDDWATSSNGYVSAMKKNIPEIESFVRVDRSNAECVIDYNDIKFREENVYFADSNFFSFFSYPIVEGSAETILKDVNTIAISESAAKKYFGNVNPLGKFLDVTSVSRKYRCLVSGVFKDIPATSSLQFNFLISWNTMPLRARDFWYKHDSYSFVKLAKGSSLSSIETKFSALAEEYKTAEALKQLRWAIQLVPLKSIHLNTAKQYEGEVKGNRKAVQYLYIIGLVILVIACVNYVNLTTARSLERAKEVGVRKVSGAVRGQLILQFCIESVIINCFALLLAIVMVFIAGYYFSPMLGQSHLQSYLLNAALWAKVMLVFVCSILLSTIYPALVLSNIEPISVLKGRFIFSPGSNLFRKILVTFQFAASLLLIAGTIAVYRQLHFMNNQQRGVYIDQTLVIKAPVRTDDYKYKTALFKKEITQMTGVKDVTFSGAIPGKKVGKFLANHPYGASSAEDKLYEMLKADFSFIKTYQLEFAAGRDFDERRLTDSTGVILNESAVKQFGFASPEKAIGERIVLETSGERPNEIIGVVKDYHQQSLQQSYTPIIIFMDPAFDWIPAAFFSVRLKTGSISNDIAGIEKKWSSIFPESSFDSFFLNDYYNRQYKGEQEFGKTFMVFSGIAIFIACLGLFGLTAYTASRKTKEIGVRKVLGASSINIARLLSSDLLKLIFIGAIVALPTSLWLISQWLNGYAFRVALTWWQFVAPVILLLLISLACIFILITKAARANPIKALRME